MATFFHFLAAISLLVSVVFAYDPSPLQDFCVGIPSNNVLVNGLACKDPNTVTANDFFFSGLQTPASTIFKGINATMVDVNVLPGLNTLGISLIRVDFAPGGVVPPHIHPRATEMLVVIEGKLEVGFVTSNTQNGNVLFTKVLNPGDVFVFPIGLIHFERNVGEKNVVTFGGFSSQNPGLYFIPMAVFGSNPDIPVDVLGKAFQLDANVVQYLQKAF